VSKAGDNSIFTPRPIKSGMRRPGLHLFGIELISVRQLGPKYADIHLREVRSAISLVCPVLIFNFFI